MIIVILLVVGGVFASLWWEGIGAGWTQSVPRYPPDFAEVFGVAVGTGLPNIPADMPKPPDPQPGPPAQVPQPGVPAQPPEQVEPPEAGADGETRITWLQLQPVTGQHAPLVEDTGDMSLAIVSIYADGKLRWGGHSGISYATIADLCKKNSGNKDFTLIIAPDHKTPWKYVYWAMQAAQENGVHRVGIGATPIYDSKKTLLVQLPVPRPTEEYVENPDIPTIKVSIEEDKTGNIEYTIGPDAGTGLQAFFNAVGSMNTEYAEFISGDYSRDVNKTPWVLIAGPEAKSGAVCRSLDAMRAAAIYTVRFGGEFPARPK
jgi:hypothetical protein